MLLFDIYLVGISIWSELKVLFFFCFDRILACWAWNSTSLNDNFDWRLICLCRTLPILRNLTLILDSFRCWLPRTQISWDIRLRTRMCLRGWWTRQLVRSLIKSQYILVFWWGAGSCKISASQYVLSNTKIIYLFWWSDYGCADILLLRFLSSGAQEETSAQETIHHISLW